MVKFPSLYEINTRVWIRRFDTEGRRAMLSDVPGSYWKKFDARGIEYIWLMGIWKTNESMVDKYCFEEYLVSGYKRALKDWHKEDVIGSPYAIDVYELNPGLGTAEDLARLRNTLNRIGIRLILDFVPNHFSAGTSLLGMRPEIFLQAGDNHLQADPHTFFKPVSTSRIFAHGMDPYFPAWQDTIQVNYFNTAAREYMISVLLDLAKLCDGVRCDMAMLSLNSVFESTWGRVLAGTGYRKPVEEFWEIAISTVKNKYPEFLFIAEAYWDLEHELQQIGFDFTYDKGLLDKLKAGVVEDINNHLRSDMHYQKKLVRFIENHDEQRAIHEFGKERSKAAAVIMSTVPGMRMYHDGQFEGRRIRLPIQLGREPEEETIKDVADFYDKLLEIIHCNVFKNGSFQLIEPFTSGNVNGTYKNILSWQWDNNGEKRLVIINYSHEPSGCRIKFDVTGYPGEFEMKDILNGRSYFISTKEINCRGFYVGLDPFQSCVFKY